MNTQCKCGSTNFEIIKKPNSPHVGLYCSECKKWIKWVSKEEQAMINKENAVAFNVENVDINKLRQQRDELTAKIKRYEDNELKKRIETNKFFIGKCYVDRQMSGECTYCKIVDLNETNKHEMKCISFVYPIVDKENIDLMYDSFPLFNRTYDQKNGIFVQYIETLTEITLDEFNEALNNWYEYIKTI